MDDKKQKPARSPRPQFDARRSAKAGRDTRERIAKRLARAGIASRRDAEAMIMAGRVSVNGEILSSPAFNVSMDDRIEVDGKPIPAIERTRLFLFHKPAGLVTTNRDPEGRKTVFDILPQGLPRLLAVGRLDIATEGLLLLTNDGGLSRILELPSTGWLRRYRVRVHGSPDSEKLAALQNGIAIDGVYYGAVDASIDRVQGSNAWLTIGLREGKNREVRNILASLDLVVNRLIRISYGPFQLGDLEPGEVREIKGRTLRDQLGERLVAQAGANFDAPVVTAFSSGRTPRQDGQTRIRRDARVEERKSSSGKSAGAADHLQARAGRKSATDTRDRASHVWMAPGARPVAKKRSGHAEPDEASGGTPGRGTSPKTPDRPRGGAKQDRSRRAKGKGSADHRR
jgi:23S rRNA pseudouridine2605 synthase